MKQITLILVLILFGAVSLTAQDFSPFYKVNIYDGNTEQIAAMFEKAVNNAGFKVIGKYHPANKNSLYVVCFTNNDLKELSSRFQDRGALASVIKLGFVEKDGKTEVSILNPFYMFYAYWGKQMGNNEKSVIDMANKILNIVRPMGTLKPFGGTLSKEELPEYHYKVFMPYFEDPDELEEYDSFEEGLAIIRENLKKIPDNSVKVYEIVIPEKNIAVFGIGLLNPVDGEAFFLPVIGESHIAAMPYELILQGNKATSLEGKYRFALYWPELTMGEFMKIKSTPGYVEDVMEEITVK
jgi:hypothetical protein